MKATIIGAGNIGLALADGLIKSGNCTAADITVTRRSAAALEKLQQKGFHATINNSEAVKQADLIFLCILPQQLNSVLDEIKDTVDASKQLLVSVVTGVHTDDIRQRLGSAVRTIRAMPNTAMRVNASMTCLSAANATPADMNLVQQIFDTMGTTIIINEEMMSAATALCACGIAFFLRSIRAASQGGVEIGFHAQDAIHIAAQTALGAAQLLLQNGSHPEEEIDKVTSPKGCTIAGLNEMEHQGLSSAMIKGIKLSANIAKELYKK
ncbi:MAG TPA: pyrroline-5-carboxylate reductase [Chitinophagaceae bacterium]|nr:pyrroline-5-carboxylate reductase [Chitinophagaceae bacterium]